MIKSVRRTDKLSNCVFSCTFGYNVSEYLPEGILDLPHRVLTLYFTQCNQCTTAQFTVLMDQWSEDKTKILPNENSRPVRPMNLFKFHYETNINAIAILRT